MLRNVGEGAAAVLMVIAQLASFTFFTGTSMGVVREHCLDLENSNQVDGADIDRKWTYILFPPLTFANLNPPGGCVRNSPLREGLSAVGIWKLPSAEAQVERHISEQLQSEP